MTVLACAVLVAMAVWVACGPPRRVWHPPAPRRRADVPVRLLVALAGVGVVIVVYAVAGPQAAGLALMGSFVVATVAILINQRVKERRVERARHEVTRAVSVIAGLLRVGVTPHEALRMAATECPVVSDASRALDVGIDAGRALRISAGRPGHEGLMVLARAWEVCQTTGAPVAPVIDRVSESMRADRSTQSTVMSELAAPRATGQLMAFLPVIGLGMGYMAGGDPLGFLTSTVPGILCLLCGVGLACVGVLWSERMARTDFS